MSSLSNFCQSFSNVHNIIFLAVAIPSSVKIACLFIINLLPLQAGYNFGSTVEVTVKCIDILNTNIQIGGVVEVP